MLPSPGQGRKPKRMRHIDLVLTGILAGLAALGGCTADRRAAARDPEPVPVAVGRAVRRTVPVQLGSIGTVEASSTVSVKARVGGEITRVHFEEGRDVARGSLLFTIDPRPYGSSLDAAAARLDRDQALLKKAEEDVRRYAGLVKQDYVTREEYDRIQSDAESLRATVRADEATVESARLEVEYCSIRSLISGRAGSLLVHTSRIACCSSPSTRAEASFASLRALFTL